ncbi:hypothetical protein L218DRAFT_288577 [Marasmius fiardii PR-910]|nr:hypothetical protein L218DRAFT_288577 [Marasmius fiardii PR-910]
MSQKTKPFSARLSLYLLLELLQGADINKSLLGRIILFFLFFFFFCARRKANSSVMVPYVSHPNVTFPPHPGVDSK